LRSAGLDCAELDARLLVGHALGLDHTALAAQAQRLLTAEEMESISALTARRLAHEPVARIIGRKEFWGLSLILNPHTFVPRPETETVVEAVLATLSSSTLPARSIRVADLCTGSGAILLALLSELKGRACGIGADISAAALGCAAANAAAQQADACFVACSYGAALAPPVDVLVCNPPYIARNDIAVLPPEVRDFDPPLALDGGCDGLDGYRAIALDARRLLAPGGLLAVELGSGQAGLVSSLFAEAGLAPSAPKYDLLGVARAVVARRLP
jgi:release factor glutamine methyltransferase